MKDLNMKDLTNDDSSNDSQYVEDINYEDIDNLYNIESLMDVEEQKIDLLTKNLYSFKFKLDKFDNEPLENINILRRDFYLLCENNRYLIDDSFFLKNLEINIYEIISYYEDKLFKVYEQLFLEQDYTNLKMDETTKIHKRMIYGEKLQKEIDSRTENDDSKLMKLEIKYHEEPNLTPNNKHAFHKIQKDYQYNNIYQISELDRIKEKYHIKYDTDKNTVEYIISAYR